MTEINPFDLNSWMNGQDVLVCVRDTDFGVRFQNAKCSQICGPQTGQKCQSFCLNRFGEGNAPATFKNAEFGDQPLTVSMIPVGNEVLTIAVPVAFADLVKILKEKGLSEREIEVALEMAKAQSNRAIAQHLSVSLATLKTHINNIYRKLGPQRSLLRRHP